MSEAYLLQDWSLGQLYIRRCMHQDDHPFSIRLDHGLGCLGRSPETRRAGSVELGRPKGSSNVTYNCRRLLPCGTLHHPAIAKQGVGGWSSSEGKCAGGVSVARSGNPFQGACRDRAGPSPVSWEGNHVDVMRRMRFLSRFEIEEVGTWL